MWTSCVLSKRQWCRNQFQKSSNASVSKLQSVHTHNSCHDSLLQIISKIVLVGVYLSSDGSSTTENPLLLCLQATRSFHIYLQFPHYISQKQISGVQPIHAIQINQDWKEKNNRLLNFERWRFLSSCDWKGKCWCVKDQEQINRSANCILYNMNSKTMEPMSVVKAWIIQRICPL